MASSFLFKRSLPSILLVLCTGGGMRAEIERQAGGNPSWNVGWTTAVCWWFRVSGSWCCRPTARRAPTWGGHCTYTPSEEIVALQTVLHRIDTGTWGDTSPDRLTATANQFGPEYQQVLDWAALSVGSVQPAFVPYTPGPFLRPFPS